MAEIKADEARRERRADLLDEAHHRRRGAGTIGKRRQRARHGGRQHEAEAR
jgi:hypothetical protein